MFGLRPTQLVLIALVVANVAMLAVGWLEDPVDANDATLSGGSAGARELAEVPAAEPVAEVFLLSERPPPTGGPAVGDDPVARSDAESEPSSEVGRLGPVDAGGGSPAATSGVGEPGPEEVDDTDRAPATAGSDPNDDSAADRASAVVPPPGEQPVCRAWGPFGDAAEATAIAKSLELGEDAYRILDRQVAGAPDYLVYIDHGGNREAGRRLLQELRTQDVEGYIMRGRFNDAISVGVFSQRALALRQQERVAALGYAPRIEVLERAQQVYYLAARVPPSAIDEAGPNKACGDIAQIPDFL